LTYDTHFGEQHKRSQLTPLRNKANYDINTFRKILDDYDYLNDENMKIRSQLEMERSKTLKLEEKLLSSQPKLSSNIKEIDSLKE
jgi:hypothetical protein